MANTSPISDFDAELTAFLEWRSDQVSGAPSPAEVSRRIADRAGRGRVRARASFSRTVPVLVALVLGLTLVVGAAWFASRPSTVTMTTSPSPSPTAVSSPLARVQPPLLAGTVAVALGVGNLDAINPQTQRTTGLVLCDTPCNGLSSPTWSPDGTQLAYLVPVGTTDQVAAPDRGVWIKDVLTRSARQLVPCAAPADCVIDRPLAWSPDGQWIAFFQGAALAVAPVDGGAIRNVIDVGTLDPTTSSLSVTWSPDSRRLNYTTHSGQWESVNVDGTDHQVHPAPLFVWLTVSPDETRIAYVTLGGLPQPSDLAVAVDPGSAALVTANADGSDPNEVAVLPGCCVSAWVGAPAWSPDGSQLAWAGYDGNPGVEHIVLLIADGDQGLQQRTPVAESRPAWAPGSTSTTAVNPSPEPLPTLVPRSSVRSSNCSAMDTMADWLGATDDPLGPRSPAPSGDPSNGSIVAGLSGQAGIDGYIGLFAPDFAQGAPPNRVLYSASDDGWSAMSDFTWSPDGSEFAFAASDGIDPDGSTGGRVTFSCGTLFAASADGTSPRRLIPPAAGYGVMVPAWSPDGTRIAYLSYQAPEGRPLSAPPVFRAMRLLDLRDGSDRAIASCPGCTSLDWSPDSVLIAARTRHAGSVSIVNTVSLDSSVAFADADATRWVGRTLLAAVLDDDGSQLKFEAVDASGQPSTVEPRLTIAAPAKNAFVLGPIAFDATGERLALAVRNTTFDQAAQVQLGTVEVATGQFRLASDSRYADPPSNVQWSPDGTQVLLESPIGVIERVQVDGSGSATETETNVVPERHGEAWQPRWP